MGQIVSDDFNRADGALGANWSSIGGSGFGLVVSGNKALVGGNNENLSYFTGAGWTGGNDQYAEAKAITLESGKDMAAACRCSGTTAANANAYLFVINSDDVATGFGSMKVTLYKQVGGAFTEITTAVTTTVNANDVIRVEAEGTTIRGKINGSTAVSTTDNSLSSGNPGMYIGSGTTSAWDDFTAGDFSVPASGPDANWRRRALRPAIFRPGIAR